MPDSDETRLALARMEGMLQAVLPQHTARLDEHDRALTNLAAIVTQQGQELSAVKAVTSERRRTPTWVPVLSAVVAVASIVITVVLYALDH